MSKSTRVEEVIITDLERRGNGTTTPIRRITQVYAKSGELIAEHDPLPDSERAETSDDSMITQGFTVNGYNGVMRIRVANKHDPTYTRDDLEELADYFADNIDSFRKNHQVVLRNWIWARMHHNSDDKKTDDVFAASFHSLADYLMQHEFCEYDSTELEWFTILPSGDNKHIIQTATVDGTPKRFISTAEIDHIRDGSSKKHYARLKREYR